MLYFVFFKKRTPGISDLYNKSEKKQSTKLQKFIFRHQLQLSLVQLAIVCDVSETVSPE